MAFNVLKNIWREEVIETPKYCSANTPVSECSWICTEDIVDNTDVQGEMSLMGFSGPDNTLPSADNTPFYDIIVRTALCESVWWPGDHLEAASPVEASFWPIHPTIDRLLQYKDLATPFIVDAYGMMMKGEESGHDGGIIVDTTELCSDKYYQHGHTCYGHNPYDVTFFKTTHKLSDGSYKQTHLTNWEVRQNQMVKGNYGLPYLYNHYEWKHCEEAFGIKFKAVEEADYYTGDDYTADDESR